MLPSNEGVVLSSANVTFRGTVLQSPAAAIISEVTKTEVLPEQPPELIVHILAAAGHGELPPSSSNQTI